MTRRLLAPLLVVLSLFAMTPAQAYWDYGHQTVAKIAWANIKPQTRTAIRRILAHGDLLDTPECKVQTIVDASTWPDCIKPLKDAAGQSRFGYAYNWHFQDVNVCQPFAIAPVCPDGNCVSAQIEHDVALLKDRSTGAKERVQALAFLVHFVGDLHQPLHAGEKGDKGGNDVGATYGVYTTQRFNLHSIWDGPLAERAITSGPTLVRRYPPAERAREAAGTVTDWSRQSWEIARDVVYPSATGGGDACAPTPKHVTLDDATIARLVPVAREQVKRGGLRLARLLDQALG